MIALLPDLRAFARMLARERTAADDLVQDALVRALGNIAQFEAGSNLKAWLFTILRNVFYEQTRRRRTERSALDGAAALRGEEAQGGPTPGEMLDLQRCLWALSPVLREALILVGAQGLRVEEAASICAVPPATMKARVSRARGQVAKLLGHPMDAG
jgi:RNA polymerase sigma-70 factor (ECF subfamily)